MRLIVLLPPSLHEAHRMLDTAAATAAALHLGLTAIAEHPRCRLPPREVRLRLERYH
jgi:hypothetical protein